MYESLPSCGPNLRLDFWYFVFLVLPYFFVHYFDATKHAHRGNGGIQILSDGDDQMGAQIKLDPKNPWTIN